MIRKFNAGLLFTDTDSLCFMKYMEKVHTKNVQVKKTI